MSREAEIAKWLNEIRILDGGFGTEAQLHSDYQVDGHKAWSCILLDKDPGLVLNIHKSYLRAGCDVISTNTYQAAPDTLAEALEVERVVAEELMRKAVKLAKQAVDEFLKEESLALVSVPRNPSSSIANSTSAKRLHPLVAGALGPYGACMADGSEYSGAYVESVSFDELIEFHLNRAMLLLSAGVDFIAWETIPAAAEVHAIVEVMRRLPSHALAWISVVTRDGQTLIHGEPLHTVAAAVNSCQSVFGVGVNCIVPHHLIGQALANVAGLEISSEANDEGYHPHVKSLAPKAASSAYPKILIAYANSGELWVVESPSKRSSDAYHVGHWIWPINTGPGDWAQSVAKWSITRPMLEREPCANACELSRRCGLAQWIGGCCRVRPNNILELSKLIKPDEFNVPGVSGIEIAENPVDEKDSPSITNSHIRKRNKKRKGKAVHLRKPKKPRKK